jgi:hypothetical protein
MTDDPDSIHDQCQCGHYRYSHSRTLWTGDGVCMDVTDPTPCKCAGWRLAANGLASTRRRRQLQAQQEATA